MRKLLVCLLSLPLALVAQDINGKWAGEIKHGGDSKKAAITVSLEFSTTAGVVSGKGIENKGAKPDKLKILNLKITGQTVVFETSRKTKDGTEVIEWAGTIKGSEMSLKSPKKKNPLLMTLKKS